MFLDSEEVVAEVQHSKAPLLPEEDDDHAARPVQPVAEALPEAGATADAWSLNRDPDGSDHPRKGAPSGRAWPCVWVPPGLFANLFLECGPSLGKDFRKLWACLGKGTQEGAPKPRPEPAATH